jgi:predicted esterase
MSILGAGPVSAAVPLAPNPSMVMAVGPDLVAVTDDWRFWRRAASEGADWQPVAPLPGEEGAKPASLYCAVDGSSQCLLTLLQGQSSHIDLFQAGRGLVRTLPVTGEVSAFPDKDTAYLIRDEGGGRRGFFRHNIVDGSDVRLGTLQPAEAVAYLHVDGVLTPFARLTFGAIREISDKPDAGSFHLPDFENMIGTRDGGLVVEAWAHEPPVAQGARYLADLTIKRRDGAGRASLETTGKWFFGFPTSGALPVPGNGASDANDDILLEMAGPERRQVGVLCRNGDATGLKTIVDLPADAATRIAGGGAAAGFLLVSSGPARTSRYQMLRLSPSPGGWRSRPCATTSATVIDANVGVEENGLLDVDRAEAVSADGARVPYVVLAPKGGSPEHILIDVYGAFAVRREIPAYGPGTRRMLAESKTAIIFPIVRGDGDKGFDWAMASAPPHRERAVDDVIAVARAVAARWPSLRTRPTVRGSSAGGWLAAKAALRRPDLFSGAIGYSGAYLLKGEPAAEQNTQRFFDPALDDLAADVSALKGECRGLHFRLLHARDDEKVRFASAETFAGLLKAQGCSVEFVPFDHGGHTIAFGPEQQADFERLRQGYFTPF